MKILMLTPYLPYPPSSGGQVRSHNLIKHLSRNHELYLVALIKNTEEKGFHKDLLNYCKEIYVCKRSESPWTPGNLARSVFGTYPFLVVRNYSVEAEAVMKRLLQKEKFDLIHAETFYIMPHIPPTDTPILLVEQTIEYRVYQHFVSKLPLPIRPFFFFDTLKLKYWEKTYWKKADLVGAVSQDDKKNMLELIPDLRVELIPNAAGEDLLGIYKKNKAAEPVFLYQGNFSWLQNVEAGRILIDRVFPAIRKIIPEAKFIIAGQRAKAKLDGNGHENDFEIVDIAPSRSDDVMTVYERASVFLAPIEGPGGTRLKILGAMAAGLPVISTPTGVSGLKVKNDRDVLIARSPEEFASQAKRLLEDSKLYDKIRQNARNLIETRYSWPAVSAHLEKIYAKLIK